MRLTRRRQILFGVLAFALLLPLAGWLYEVYAQHRDRSRFPPAGRLVDVDHRNVHVLCVGTGTPTIVFEPSGFGNSLSAREARTALSAMTKVCSYDRMGTGWSDRGPSSITVAMLADDLRALADTQTFESPFIIVASSIGGLPAELFAREHPDAVEGLVLLDAATGGMLPRVGPMIESANIGTGCSAIRAAGRMGVVRLLDPFGLRKSAHSDARSTALLYGAQPWETLCAMVRGLPDSRRQFETVDPLARSIAVTALSAERTDDLAPPGFEAWAGPAKSAIDQGLHAAAERSAHGSWQIVPGSSHLIAESAPQAVVAATRQLIERARQRDDRSASRVH